MDVPTMERLLTEIRKRSQIDAFFAKMDHDSPLWTTPDWFILYLGLRQANEKMKIDNRIAVTDLSKITDHIPAG